ncbi:MAG: hypothetical protein ABFC57_08950 [Veillonellales bacterium]
MTTFSPLLTRLTNHLTISDQQIEQIAVSFTQAIEDGLTEKSSPLKMLPSYLAKPTGQETGIYLALDFGGTNVRVLLIELLGQGQSAIRVHSCQPLQDYLSPHTSAEALFNAIAAAIGRLAPPGVVCYLGHTFSFPSRQQSINHAVLLDWTKEIKTAGMKGRNVNQLLQEALIRCRFPNVIPKAILNDTTGTLLTGVFQHPSTDIGSICGTGHNTAYLEPHSPLTGQPMILNLESGNFDQLPVTYYDIILDKTSDNPGRQCLEKMVSGRYLGELLRLIATDLFPEIMARAKPGQPLATPYALTSEDITRLLSDHTPVLDNISNWLNDRLQLPNSSLKQRTALKQIAGLLIARSARLIAATYLGTLRHIDPECSSPHAIAIDGSLYEKVPGYAQTIRVALMAALGEQAEQVTVNLVKDGSGIGAAIAAAIAVKSGA